MIPDWNSLRKPHRRLRMFHILMGTRLSPKKSRAARSRSDLWRTSLETFRRMLLTRNRSVNHLILLQTTILRDRWTLNSILWWSHHKIRTILKIYKSTLTLRPKCSRTQTTRTDTSSSGIRLQKTPISRGLTPWSLVKAILIYNRDSPNPKHMLLLNCQIMAYRKPIWWENRKHFSHPGSCHSRFNQG